MSRILEWWALTDEERASAPADALIQSPSTVLPDFVDPAWLREPDYLWTWEVTPTAAARKRLYEFTDAQYLPYMPHSVWMGRLRAYGASKPTLRLADALGLYGDFTTGRGVWVSNRTVAEAIGVRRESVNEGLKRLVRDGWLVQTGKGPHRGTIEYARTAPALRAAA